MRKWFLFGIAVAMLFGCDAKLPEFAGVYVLQGGKYIEVARIKDMKPIAFNHQRRNDMFGSTDCNVKVVFRKDQFVAIDQDTINKKGFLVVQNKEWSEIKLFRVPNSDYLQNNEKGNEIVTSVGYGCGMMGMPISAQGLLNKMEPKEIEIKQAPKGANAFIYVPAMPVEKGYYLIDYKLNGQNQTGWNPIVVK